MFKTPKSARSGKRIRPLRVVVLAAAALAVFAVYLLFSDDLLFLQGGGVVAADRSWTLEDNVFYEQGGAVRVLEADKVLFLSKAFRLSATDARRRLQYLVRQTEQGPAGMAKGPAPSFVASAAAMLIAAALLAVAVAVGAVSMTRSRRNVTEAPQSPTVSGKKAAAETPLSPRLAGRNDVVRYFFRLYRMQLKASPEAPGKIEPLETDPDNPGRRFRLGIRIDDDWKWRYMTIRPIGEATGSKSQCFYVIYDTHLVVKIPPVPIRDFTDYIERIQVEAEIVRTLFPRKCIIPNVSVILNKIHRLGDAELRSAEQREEAYIRLLERRPGLHHCLKIDNEFVFFMELSRDYFLSHALTGPAGDDIRSVLAEDAGLIADCRGFELRYGADKGWICLELQRLYERFESELEKALRGAEVAEVPGDPRKQHWFHRHLCDPSAPLSGGSASVLSVAAELLAHILSAKKEAVDEYRRLAVPHARRISFERTRPMKSAIATNLLDLLAWLERCRVAIRDLKPDNLLVSGDGGRYPTFLTSAGDFSIGLIDLETAVIVSESAQQGCRQPQLGGTPTYATPSHFLPNRLLELSYDSLAEVFFLQDWYAVIGIVFAAVTGRRLFSRCAGMIPAQIGAMTNASRDKTALLDVFHRHNALFWENARAEFTEKSARHSALLRATFVQPPEAIAQALKRFADREDGDLSKRICAILEAQNTIRNPKTRRDLSTCTHGALVRAMEKARLGAEGGNEDLKTLFERLSELKKRQERVQRFGPRLEKSGGKLPVEDLLHLMFERVHRVLSKEGDAPSRAAAEPVQPVETGDVNLDAKLSYTHTADL